MDLGFIASFKAYYLRRTSAHAVELTMAQFYASFRNPVTNPS
jgi:hypothetical protein